MRRVLLGSTALLGAAMIFAGPAAAEMETTVGGFMRAEFWSTSQDVDGSRPRGYNFGIDDAELYIRAKNTADNGLSYGVNIDMELRDSIDIDEGYIFFSGEFGIVQLGGNDAPGIDMVYSGDFSLVATGGYDGGLGASYNFQNAITGADLLADPDDSAKLIYYSPRFSGFQIGVSYGTDAQQTTTGSDKEVSDASDPGSTMGAQEDQVSVGVNFVDTINGVDIGVGIGYITSDTESGGTAEDAEGLHVGFNIGFSGFTFGASYADNFDTGCDTATAGCDGGEWYEIAAGYSTGPFAIGAGYFHTESDLTSTTDEEMDIFAVTGKYTIAPGAAIYAEVDFIDESGSGITNNDGTIFMVGAVVSY